MSKVFISMHIDGEVDTGALATFLGNVSHKDAGVFSARTEPAPAEKPAAKKADPKPDKVAAEPAAAEEPGSDEVELRAEAVKQLQAVNAANGREAVTEVLAEFGVKNISAVPSESLQALIDKCKEKTQ